MHADAWNGRLRLMVVAMFAVVGLSACSQAGEAAPTATLGASIPRGVEVGPTANAEPSENTPIVIDQPAAGTVLGSPQTVIGRLVSVPPTGGLIYRVLDAENVLIATGTVATTGDVGGTGGFEAQVLYTSRVNGPGFLQIIQRDDYGGPAVAVATQPVMLTPNVTTPPTAEALFVGPTMASMATMVPSIVPATLTPTVANATAQSQTITIASPAAGTTVGSPMTISGSTSRYPFEGNLEYRVIDAANNPLGNGSFAVTGQPGQPTAFTTEIQFTLPASAGNIRVDVYDQDTASGQVAAISGINLVVAAPSGSTGQRITITSPSAGALVGSPVVITGNVANLPFGNALVYRVFDTLNQQIGTGTFGVNSTNFTAQITFALPQSGGGIRIELSDRDSTTNRAISSESINLQVAPQPTSAASPQSTATPNAAYPAPQPTATPNAAYPAPAPTSGAAYPTQ